MDAPVVRFIGIGECRAADQMAKRHMVKLGGLCLELRFDAAQAFGLSKLAEGHAAQLLGAGERTHPMIATVTDHDAVERLPEMESMSCASSVLPAYMCPAGPADAAQGWPNRSTSFKSETS